MSLIHYVRIVWKHKWLVFLTVVIVVGTTAGVTRNLPQTYTATATLKVKPVATFDIPGYISSAEGADIDAYVELVNTTGFKGEVLALAKKERENIQLEHLELNEFSLSAEGLPKSNVLVLSVEAPHPMSARSLANAAVEVLIGKITVPELGVSKELRKVVTKELQSLDKRLAKLRAEMENLRARPAASSRVDKSTEMARLQDEVDSAKGLRYTYKDLLARLSLNDLLQRSKLQLIYPVVAPSHPLSPSLPKNLLVSVIASLLLGVGATILLDYLQEQGLTGKR